MADPRDKRNVVLGVTGSIAAYKAAELARILVSRGYAVRVVMTDCAQKFITPLTFDAVTAHSTSTDFFDGSEAKNIGHIQLADWADIVVIAPATANIIAKLAHGIADCPVSTVALAARSPVLVCPAMNVNMWNNKATQDNLAVIRERGIHFVEPEEGELACGYEGTGRLANPWQIFYDIRRHSSVGDYKGYKVLVTTGPTREDIDPVRFLTNRSSGRMGVAVAQEAYRRGAEVVLVHGPVKVQVPSKVRRVAANSAQEMRESIMREMAEFKPDMIVMAAAVADYRPKERAEFKIKKSKAGRSIEVVPNPDILAELGKNRNGERPILVGFAVETGELEDLITYARSKLEEKNCDIIVGNFANEAFDLDTNRVWIIDRNGKQEEVATTFKSRIASKILDKVIKFA